jgi:uncharacterized membrane protein HdeD (DUF308 family)
MRQMTDNTPFADLARRARWSALMGVLTAVVGVVMIVYPFATATVSTVFLGTALIVAAGAQFVFAFTSQTAGSFFLKLLLGVLYVVAGAALAFFPLAGVVTLTALLGGLLVAEAIVEVVLAFALPASAGRGWFLLSAAASLLLGVLFLAQWPASSAWAIGTLVGVAVLTNGITRTAVSVRLRSELRELQPHATAA